MPGVTLRLQWMENAVVLLKRRPGGEEVEAEGGAPP